MDLRYDYLSEGGVKSSEKFSEYWFRVGNFFPSIVAQPEWRWLSFNRLLDEMRKRRLANYARIKEDSSMQRQIEQRSTFDKVIIWLGLAVASVTGLIAYCLVVLPLQHEEKKEQAEAKIEAEIEAETEVPVLLRQGMGINLDRVLEVVKGQITAKLSVVVFEGGTGVFIDEPTNEPIALAKAALAFEAERQVAPQVNSAGEGNFLVTHGVAVMTVLFEEDLKKEQPFWEKFQRADELDRTKLLQELSTSILVSDAKNGEVYRVVKALSKPDSPN